MITLARGSLLAGRQLRENRLGQRHASDVSDARYDVIYP